jgi:hypothetical protein
VVAGGRSLSLGDMLATEGLAHLDNLAVRMMVEPNTLQECNTRTGGSPMSTITAKPEEQMAALFKGLSRIEQLELLGRLEMAGGQVYRSLAADEKNAKAKEALLKAAGDEERNGGLLGLMTTPKLACENARDRWRIWRRVIPVRFSARFARCAQRRCSSFIRTAVASSKRAVV